MYLNCIIVISNNVYFVYNFLRNFIHYKPSSAYRKKFGKSETTAPSAQQFSPKVDRYELMFG